jgi:phosphoglycerate dehydrogenase-like enzyme
VEGRGEGIRGDGRVSAAPLRILASAETAQRLRPAVEAALQGAPHVFVDDGGADADLAFVSRDVTGLSTKHELLPATRRFYDAMLQAPSLRWVHVHSAGADRQVFVDLRARGVAVTTSSGSNAAVVAHSAVAGVLALARRFPQLWAAQRERRWAPLIGSGLPRDLSGQHAVVVGWGPIGQEIARLLQAFGLHVTAVRRSAEPAAQGVPTLAYEDLPGALPQADWIVLACPLGPRTRGLLCARAIAALPATAHVVNVARGEVIDEPALVEALRGHRIAGAFLDVFAHEPLPAESPLWSLPNVIVTPHSAGFSDGNAARVDAMFLDNLRRWRAGTPLHNEVRAAD